jgi:microcin C transport system permease protein
VTSYFLRRALLIIPTFLGITLVVFVITHFVPGGPVEREIMRMRMGTMSEGGVSGGGGRGAMELPEDAVEQIRQYYGFDKPVHIRYALWLWKVLHFDLGNSYIYQDPVWDVIKSRFPISITLGLTGFLLSYLVCIPLGVLKAVKHGSKLDFVSSVVVFMGYAVPGWALGTALLVLFGGGSFWSVFPLGGFHSDNWDYLPFWDKVADQLRHMALPVLCYMVGEFATLTILTKNALMENMSQDYIRTAFAKGLHKRRVIFVHALRNSMIPLATGLGHVFSLILAGSFLIEKVFNIDGMGYLGYQAIIQRDYPIALGILVIGSVLMLIGNIISDMIYAFVDPRIRFK